MARVPSDLRQRARAGSPAAAKSARTILRELALPPGADGAADAKSPPPRLTVPLNSQWSFRRIDATLSEIDNPAQLAALGEMERVALPHSVRLEPLNACAGRNFQGTCWYQRQIDLPAQWKDKVVYLHFDGAMQVADVWLNGQHAAANYCGYLPFVIDLSKIARFGHPNTLTLRLDNRDNPDVPPGKKQAELDFTYFGGLYRSVRLEMLDRLHIVDPILEDRVAGGGVFVTFPQVSERSATIAVQTDIRNEHSDARQCRVTQVLIDPSGREVTGISELYALAPGEARQISQSLNVAAPMLWHPDHPHLFRLKTTLSSGETNTDQLITRIGIRRIEFDAKKGMLINGRKFFSIGANRHQDHPYVGYAMPDSAHYRDAKKLREAGFTSVRSHYPQSPAFMDACDELGILAIVSNPGWQFVGGDLFRRRAIANARRMVRRDRNHASAILWEAALNESDNAPIIEALHAAVHEEYPGDQCFTAGDREGALGWDVEYLRNDGTKPAWIREWGDQVDNWSDQQSRSRVPRRWGETPMLIQARSHATRLEEILSGHSNHAGPDEVSRLAGACLWAGIDCQRGYHRQPFFGGVLDLFRIPKFNYHFFRSQIDTNLHIPGLDLGPMVFIANFATFLSPTNVTVFSNCQEVRLTLDGVEIGRQRPAKDSHLPHPPMEFTVQCFAHEQSTMYMTGVARVEKPPIELLAEGLIDGKVVARHRVCPPGAPRRIVLEIDRCGRDLQADGADWIRIHALICDSRGTLCPMADDEVEFSVTKGDGQFIGDRRIAANPIKAEAGIATALLQAGAAAGPIEITASAFALESASAQVMAVEPSKDR
jgi:beta-galactosidase